MAQLLLAQENIPQTFMKVRKLLRALVEGLVKLAIVITLLLLCPNTNNITNKNVSSRPHN